MKRFREEYFLCDCRWPTHVMSVSDILFDEGYLSISMEVEVGGLWDRIKSAVGYLLKGHRQGYGHWHEVLLTKSDARRMRDIIDIFIEQGLDYPPDSPGEKDVIYSDIFVPGT